MLESGEALMENPPGRRRWPARGQHGLAHPRRAEERRVGPGLDEAEGGQVVDLAGLELGLEGEVDSFRPCDAVPATHHGGMMHCAGRRPGEGPLVSAG